MPPCLPFYARVVALNCIGFLNTQTTWQFVCLNEKLLVAPGTDDPPVPVEV